MPLCAIRYIIMVEHNSSSIGITTTTSSSSQVRLGIYQGQSKIYDIQHNLSIVHNIIKLSQDEYQCDIILFPELYLHGYELHEHYESNVQSTALTQSSDEIRQIQQWAKQYTSAVCISYIELDSTTNNIYNSTLLIDYTGTIVTNYRKTHLWYKQERYQFSAGSQLSPVYTLQLNNNRSVRTSICICYDIEFPEVVRTIALQKCELLLVPTALTINDNFITPMILLRARAYENHIYIAYCNYIAQSDLSHLNNPHTQISPNNFIGCSGVIEPTGAEIVRAACSPSHQDILPNIIMPFDKTAQDKYSHTIHSIDNNELSQLLVCNLNPRYWAKQFEQVDYLNDRRPELYQL